MEIIIDKNDYATYGNSTYKGFYDKLMNKFNIANLEYNLDNLREFLWQNRAIGFQFVVIGFDLSKITEGKSYDDVKWKEIFSAINGLVLISSNNTLTFKNCVGEFVNKIVIDKTNYASYGHYTFKGFYNDIYNKLDGKNSVEFANIENCHYNADLLNDFLWSNYSENIKFVFLNFDLQKIKTQKTYDNYEWGLIIDVVSRFVNEYPNNALEFE